MIIHAHDTQTTAGRTSYPLPELDLHVAHFVIRLTTSANPFRPHAHAQPELWFILDGQAIATLDGHDHPVAARDLIVIEPWVEHGLRVERRAEWICLG